MSDYGSRHDEEDRRFVRGLIKLGLASAIVVVSGVGSCMRWYPEYSVYQQRMAGEAELAQAEYSKKVQVADAQGRLNAATLLASAEVERAKGVAAANKIIGDSLKDNEAYLKYLWITDVTGSNKPSMIYVPTEANIPILEAGKLP